MVQTSISEAITTLAEAERRFNLLRIEKEQFFPEWHRDLQEIPETEKAELDKLRQRYLYHRTEGHLLEGAVTLLVASPLLSIAGFYDPPFKIRSEHSVQLNLQDTEETLQGRIDVLVLHDQLWVVVLESKKSMLSVWAALPQALAYLMANPDPEHPSFGLITNGDEIAFIKLVRSEKPQYNLSRPFALLTSNQELYCVLQVLKRLGQRISQPAE